MENLQFSNFSAIASNDTSRARFVNGIPYMINSSDSGSEKKDGASNDISVTELHQLASSGADIYLIDVRTETEYLAGRLDFSDDLIPYDKLSKNLDLLPAEKETPIYLFCRSGRRSGIATNYLRSLGYSQAFNVAGGIVAWQDAGFQITDGPPATDSNPSK